jgi:hypothetical protein
MQAILAAVGLLASIAAWLAGATFWWLVGGILLGSVIPFTLIVILPTNKELLSPTLDRRSPQTERLFARWARCTPREVRSAEWHCCYSCTWRFLGSSTDVGEALRFTTFARGLNATLLKALRNIPFPHSSRVWQRQHCIILRSKCCIVLIRSSCDSSSTSFRRDSFCHRLEAGVPLRKPKKRCLISSRVKPVCLALCMTASRRSTVPS